MCRLRGHTCACGKRIKSSYVWMLNGCRFWIKVGKWMPNALNAWVVGVFVLSLDLILFAGSVPEHIQPLLDLLS